MFKFVESIELDKNVSSEYIKDVEIKYNIIFPNILKEYYLNYNISKQKECTFKIKDFGDKDTEFILDTIIPLKYGTIPFEKEYGKQLEYNYIPSYFIPFAYDIDSDKYYWNSENKKVYYISQENVEHPILICNTVEEFFEILNNSCEKTITIENLIVKEKIKKITDNENSYELNGNNEYDINKILRYNNKLILISILILSACTIISLTLMPFTDGLSIIFSFIFGSWLLVFVIIDIVNRVISNNALKKYNIDEVKKELSSLKTEKLEELEVYLTENYIISNCKKVCITKYSDIVWTYLITPSGRVVQKEAIAISHKFSGTPIRAHLKNGKQTIIAIIKNNEQLNKIFNKILTVNNNVLIGYTISNIKSYENVNKKFKTKNKMNSIVLIIIIMLLIVGYIYTNFIK